LSRYPDELREVLIRKWAYKPSQVDDVVKKLEGISIELQEAFSQFLETDEFPNSPRYFGLSPLDIAKNYTFKPPAVFLMLKWVMDEPMEALDFLVREFRKPLPDSFNPKELHAYTTHLEKTQETSTD